MDSDHSKHQVLWLVTIVALAAALMELPYGYYQLLRVLVFCVACYFAVRSHEAQAQVWTWVFIGLAIIYNPILKLGLGADLWPFVNLGTIFVFANHMWQSKRRRSPQ